MHSLRQFLCLFWAFTSTSLLVQAWTPVCHNNEVTTVPPLGSRFDRSALQKPTFSVVVTYKFSGFLTPPPPATPQTYVSLNLATQAQLNQWQSWWANTTGAGDQQLFTLVGETWGTITTYTNALINITNVGGASLKLTFRTPANFTLHNYFFVSPGGSDPHWQGKILLAGNNMYPFVPEYRDLMAPVWIVSSPVNQTTCHKNGDNPNTWYQFPNYVGCKPMYYDEVLGVEYAGIGLNLAYSNGEQYFYNATTKLLQIYVTANGTGNNTITFSAGKKPINFNNGTIAQKYIKGHNSVFVQKQEALVYLPVQPNGISHSITNEMSTARDLPAYIVEQDSMFLIQVQLDLGTVVRPVASFTQQYWTLKVAGSDPTWSTVNDIMAKYSYAWIPVSLEDGDYDLLWYQGGWYRQYSARWYTLADSSQVYEISRPWYVCQGCSLRNLPALFSPLYHWFFHNRNELYFAYKVTPGATPTQDHRLSVTVSSPGGSSTIKFASQSPSYYIQSPAGNFWAASGLLDTELTMTYSWNNYYNYTLLQRRDGSATPPTGGSLLTVENAVTNPNLVCGGLYVDDLDIMTASTVNPNYDFCWDFPDGCLDNTPVMLRRYSQNYYAFEDSRLGGATCEGPNMCTVHNPRAFILNNQLKLQYKATLAAVDWWLLIRLENVTVSDTP